MAPPLNGNGLTIPTILASAALLPVQPKPLSPLESRCYAALRAFQQQHDRLPSLRELTEAAGFSDRSQTGDVLHRLVCKG